MECILVPSFAAQDSIVSERAAARTGVPRRANTTPLRCRRSDASPHFDLPVSRLCALESRWWKGWRYFMVLHRMGRCSQAINLCAAGMETSSDGSYLMCAEGPPFLPLVRWIKRTASLDIQMVNHPRP